MSDKSRVQYEVGESDRHRAKIPHELFLTNLIANHILAFIATLGMVRSMVWPLLCVPAISMMILLYTLWRARRALRDDPWFVMCHWQLSARRSRIFLLMLGFMMIVSVVAWYGYDVVGMRKETALALAGGFGMLPTMVGVLALIVMESDALYQAMHGRMPRATEERYRSRQ